MVASADGVNKTCVMCSTHKELSWFHRDRTSKDGHEHRCKPCKFAYNKARVAKKKDEISVKRKIYYSQNGERERANHIEWNKRNHRHVINYAAKYRTHKMRTDYLFRFKETIKSRIQRGIERRGYRREAQAKVVIGCSYDRLLEHLVNSALYNYGFFMYDMTYEIDHIVPLHLATTKEEVIKLNHYTNLQFLYPEDNRAKSGLIGWDIREINQRR